MTLSPSPPVFQDLFQEYLALSASFLNEAVEKGSSDGLPVVRAGFYVACAQLHKQTRYGLVCRDLGACVVL